MKLGTVIVFKNVNKSDLFFCSALILFGILWLHSIHIRSWHFDDSFFGYTYARNLVDGNGFTFNGVKVIGTSAPLPVLLYSGIAKLLNTDDIVPIAEHFSVATVILSSILLYFFVLGTTHLKLAGFFSALSYYLNINILFMFGHESLVAIFLILASFVLSIKKKHVLGYFVLGLACLCRAESIFAGVYMVFQTLSDKPLKRENVKTYLLSAVWFSAPLLVWFSFSFVYFGQLFSNSLKFKILQSALEGVYFLPSLVWFLRMFVANNNEGFMAMCTSAMIMTIGLLYALKSKNTFMLILSLGVFPIMFYSAINIGFYCWFLFLSCLLLSIFVGVSTRIIFELYDAKNIQTEILKYALCVVLIAPFFYSSYKFIKDHGSQVSSLTSYERIGEYLRANIPQNSSIGYIEVGQIGYYSQRKIIDLTGMVTKGVVEHLKLRDFNWTYEEYKPDYILDNPAFCWVFDFSKSNIKSNYTLIHTFDPWGALSSPLYLYKRNN